MKYNLLGKTGLEISLLGFGAMRLPIKKDDFHYEASVELIQNAVVQGINFFDVGTFYCHFQCEKVFGMSTQHLHSDAILFCGKNSAHQNNDKDWFQQLEKTLSFYYRTCLDMYFLHYLDLATWESYFMDQKIFTQVLDAQKKNYYRFLGFSSHDTPINIKKIIDTGQFSAVILPFNLLQQTYRDVMVYAHERGLGVIAMNPLAGGILANPYFHNNVPFLTYSWATQALNYVLSQPFIDCVLSGMESINIIDKNAKLVDGKRFTQSEMETIQKLVDQECKQNWLACTGCGYCLPCVQGIDIPKIIAIHNQYSITQGEKLYAREYYSLAYNADNCVQCCLCNSRCPQKLDIPGIMLQVGEKFLTP